MKHHYYPRFAVKRWVDESSLVQPYEWAPDSANDPIRVLKRKSPKSICSELDLYALKNVDESLRYHVETNFFASKIDEPASNVLLAIEEKGIKKLDNIEKKIWSRFIVSIPARMPETIDKRGISYAQNFLNENSAEYLDSKREGDPDSFFDFAEREAPGYVRDTILQAIPRLIMSDDVVNQLLHMNWWIKKFHNHEILLGDRPLLSSTDQINAPCAFNAYDPRHMIALPISPRAVFFASHSSFTMKQFKKQGEGVIALRP